MKDVNTLEKKPTDSLTERKIVEITKEMLDSHKLKSSSYGDFWKGNEGSATPIKPGKS